MTNMVQRILEIEVAQDYVLTGTQDGLFVDFSVIDVCNNITVMHESFSSQGKELKMQGVLFMLEQFHTDIIDVSLDVYIQVRNTLEEILN